MNGSLVPVEDLFADPSPPSGAEIEQEEYVDSIAYRLQQAADPLQENFEPLSGALDLLRHRRRGCVFIAEQRDRLLELAALAELRASDVFPAAYSPERLAAGFDALCGQIMLAAETVEQRSCRARDEIADIWDWARILQNDAHNLSLAERIEERAERRSARVAKNLEAWGLKAAA